LVTIKAWQTPPGARSYKKEMDNPISKYFG